MGLLLQQAIELSTIIIEKKCKNVCMIGVQNILFDPKQYNDIMKIYGYNIPVLSSKSSYELFANIPGVERVSAVDFSDFEGADILLDLNSEGASDKFKNTFDIVIDGGTLEHVFNQYNALANMNSLVKEDGYIYHALPCMGWGNHSFYNYSPTFFTDVYNCNYGWKLEKLNFFSLKSEKQYGIASISQDCRMFLNNEEIEKWLADIDLHSSQVQIISLAKKSSQAKDNICPVQGMYSNIENYVRQSPNSKNIYEEMADLLINESEVVFWGRGHECQMILDELFKQDAEDIVKCIFDSNIEFAGTVFRGIPVKYPTRKKLQSITCKVMITSSKYMDEIYESLIENGISKENIIKLY